MTKELKVSRIEQGTVIDHLPAGTALKIAKILSIDTSMPFIIAMNVDSSKSRKKDMIKIENKFLSKEETDKISLIAPNATINIIKRQKVSGKRKVSPPAELNGILTCPNTECVTNREDCTTRFSKTGNKYKCHFCERRFSIEDFEM
jgi:aspartate carbamoyltransferase regulatory subunit